MLEPNYLALISSELSLKSHQVEAVLTLTAEWSTVPFIARYRKERTGELDENQIRDIIDIQKREENLYKAKVTAIEWIREQWLLTPELEKTLENAKSLKEVEDIYAPFRLKKKTKAMLAIENGWQVVADMIKRNSPFTIPESLLALHPREEIIEWAIEIIAAEIAANGEIRDVLRNYLSAKWLLISKKKSEKMLEKLNEKTKWEVKKFDIYAEFTILISRVKPYQTLALNRGENLDILTVKIDRDDESLELVRDFFPRGTLTTELEEAIKKWYTTLFKSVETEIRGNLTEKWEDESIATFQTNLANLLMTRPEYGKKILGIDPGYRTGCKIVVLDPLGNPLTFSKIFLDSKSEAEKILKNLCEKYIPDIIVVWNGTGSDETIELLQSILSLPIFIVNESWASVYSASEVAQEEFPDLDVTDRGTISIARRYIDPLSELVKIPVWSIWVGMYQHDIAEKKLEERLGYTVEDTVNQVGVNVNTASVHVLSYISGLDKRTAKKVYNHRPYASRTALAKILTSKAYEQAIGFLRIPESKEILDNTDIHPDQYILAKYILDHHIEPKDFSLHRSELEKLYTEVGSSTLEFIWESYESIGRDPRTQSSHREAQKKKTLETLKEGDILTGVVRNVVAFGAFVDIGMKNDGLVHISEIADRYVKNPMDHLSVGQEVKTRVVKIDATTGKIQLSLRGI